MSRSNALPLLLLLAGCGDSEIEIGDKPVDGDDTGVPDTAGDTAADTDTSDTADTADTDDGTLPPDWLVDCEGGGDFLTVQEAIDAATSGDRIGLAPCVYHERVDYRGKYLDVYGIEGSAETTIDGDGGGTVVDVEVAERDFTRLAGVTITGGYDPSAGAGIEVAMAAVDLDDVVFTGNEGWAIVHAAVGWVDMVDVVVEDNVVLDSAIFADGGSLSATRVDVDCGAGVNALYQHNASLIADSTLRCDGGYGLQSYHGELDVRRSRVTGGLAGIWAYDEEDTPSERARIWNSAVGGGLVGADLQYMTVEIANSVLWGDDAGLALLGDSTASWVRGTAFVGAACGVRGDGARYDLAYVAFWDNAADTCDATATSTVTGDPLFVSFPDDLALGAGSPLIDAGPAGAEWADADGSRNDVGRYGGPQGAW